ncbi:MAG: COX15/CtaA family protein [Betaproteobacteria bacterium]|nr:COX15/CtaA family protein [Betaproteobacteria bacterium]
MDSRVLALLRALLLAGPVLAAAIIVLGAYVRLSDAGLSCPDWPGCYGQLTVPMAPQAQQEASQAFPERPLHPAKAWKEMLHRYLAGSLGLLILAIVVLAWQGAVRRLRSPWPATGLLALILGQALLGMWTVTLLLRPLVVTAHLLGGMGTLALLLYLRWRHYAPPAARMALAWGWPWLLLPVLALQIALGGWVSSNYAAAACADLPRCQGLWWPAMDFPQAFTLHRELGMTGDGHLLSLEALTAIHWSHRLGALVVTLLACWLARYLVRRGQKRQALILMAALGLQLALGLANVLLGWPLAMAVAHNAGAALLLAAALGACLVAGPAGQREVGARSGGGSPTGISPPATPPRGAW